MNIAVIGAGIAGIAAAIRLQAKGHQVTVFEANNYAGGKLSELNLGDYRFDAGPSLFTMPQFVEELFNLANKKPLDYDFEYQKLPIICKYFWEDNTHLVAYADQTLYEQEVELQLGISAKRLRTYLAWSRFKYEATAPVFLERSLHKWATYLRWQTLWSACKLPLLGLLSTLNGENRRNLKHPKLVQLFNRYATYNGSSPYRTPGIMSLIPHLEQHYGAFLPKGGMHQITKSLLALAKDLGVEFRFNQKVDEIICTDHKAKGIRIGSQVFDFDSIVCNMDVFFAYDKLMPKLPRPERILSQPKSSSALIFYWGIKGQFPELDVHNIFFSEDYKAEFDCIFEQQTIFEDPTVYVHISSKLEKSDAPEGSENWFVMINVPALANQNWDVLIVEARQQILKKLARILGKDIESLIEVEDILEPRTIESRTQSHLGSLYGTSSNNQLAAFLRHPNFSSRIERLYFCGGSVHPGGGIPLCLLSAKIATDLIK